MFPTHLSIDPLEQIKFHEIFDTHESFSGFGSWQACVQSAIATVNIVRCLTSQDFALISPTMAAVFWLPTLVLVLHHRTRNIPVEQANAASSAEVLKAALKNMGANWNIARKFYGKHQLTPARIFAFANLIADAIAALRTDPVTASTELQMRYTLQFYSSPLISVSRGTNKVHVPFVLQPASV
jgi:hypothetical protein